MASPPEHSTVVPVVAMPQPATRPFAISDPSIFQLVHKILGMHIVLYSHLEGDSLIVQEAYSSTKVRGAPPFRAGMAIPLEHTFCQFVCRSARPLVISDAAGIAPFSALPIHRDMGFAAYVGLPLIRQNGAILGTISGLHYFPIAIDIEQIGMMQVVADALLSQIERITMLQQLERQRAAGLLALRDALTGLPNRRAFDDAVEAGIARAASDSHALALIFADIDHFKLFNDQHGHDTGDAVLRLIAARLTWTIGDAGMVFRLGGEELVTLLPNTDGKAALTIAERLRQAVRADIAPHETGLDGCPIDLPPDLHITASFGVAVYPTDAANVAELLKHADMAMYHAKRTGRDRVSATRTGDDIAAGPAGG